MRPRAGRMNCDTQIEIRDGDRSFFGPDFFIVVPLSVMRESDSHYYYICVRANVVGIELLIDRSHPLRHPAQ